MAAERLAIDGGLAMQPSFTDEDIQNVVTAISKERLARRERSRPAVTAAAR